MRKKLLITAINSEKFNKIIDDAMPLVDFLWEILNKNYLSSLIILGGVSDEKTYNFDSW